MAALGERRWAPAAMEAGRRVLVPLETVPEARAPWAGRKVFALRVRGASMAEDGLRDGDRLIVERRAAADGQTAVVEVDGQVTVKRLFRDPDGTMRLQPASPGLLPLVIAARKLRVLGVVVGVVRRHGFRAVPDRSSRNRRSPPGVSHARDLAVHPAAARPSLVDDLAGSLRSLRDCYRGTANPRLRRALLREARELVRRLCRFDVELR